MAKIANKTTIVKMERWVIMAIIAKMTKMVSMEEMADISNVIRMSRMPDMTRLKEMPLLKCEDHMYVLPADIAVQAGTDSRPIYNKSPWKL